MRTLKPLLSAVVVLALVASGFPVFNSQDASRNMRIDLEDAILHLKDFVQSSDSSDGFLSDARGVISTLRILAGLKADLRPANDAKSKASQVGVDLVYLLPSSGPSMKPETCWPANHRSISYESVFLTPDTPPPKLA